MSYCVTHDVEWEDETNEDGDPTGEALNHNEEAGCEVVAEKPKEATKDEDFPATKSKVENSTTLKK